MISLHSKKILTFTCFSLVLLTLSNANKANAFSIFPNGLEQEAQPGETLDVEFTVSNEDNAAQSYYIKPVNLIMDGTRGEQKFLSPGQGGSYELADWIKLTISEFELKANEEKKITYQLEIPQEVSSGGHYGGVIVFNKSQKAEQTSFGIAGGIAFLNFIKIPGDINESLDVKFTLKEDKKFFTQIPDQYEIEYDNNGNIHLIPTGNIYIENQGEKNIDTINLNPDYSIVLPNSKRILDIEKQQPEDLIQVSEDSKIKAFFQNALNQARDFHLGKYSLAAKTVYGENQDKLKIVTIKVWIIPWQLLSIVAFGLILALTLVIFIVLRIKKNKKNKDSSPFLDKEKIHEKM